MVIYWWEAGSCRMVRAVSEVGWLERGLIGIRGEFESAAEELGERAVAREGLCQRLLWAGWVEVWRPGRLPAQRVNSAWVRLVVRECAVFGGVATV